MESWIIQGVAVAAASYLLYLLVRFVLWYRTYFTFFNSLPGETDFHWFHGNMHKVPTDTEKRLAYQKALMKKYPKYYRVWQGPFKGLINVFHPDTVKIFLKSSEPKPMGFMGTYQFAKPWLGDGLLLASGPQWARARRLLTPAFHFDILKPYTAVYNSCAEILLNKMDKVAKNGQSFELFGNVSLCTLDIMLRCAMSYEDDIQLKGETHPYVQAVGELAVLWGQRIRQPLFVFDWIYFLSNEGRQFAKNCRYVHSLSEDIIEKRKKTLEEKGPSNKRYLDFLDILLTARDETGTGLTKLEIRNEVDTFLFEGHDTTASAISWILYAMATHPEIQRRVQEEIDRVLVGRQDPQIQYNDLGDLVFMTQCIKEGMRLYSPVPFIQRQVTKPTEIDGQVLPAGTSVSIHLLHLHHNTEVWDKPDEFRPERFQAGERADTDTYAYVPFSAGPRNCIGQHFALNEEKVVLARILQRYNLELDPNHTVKRKVASILRAENGIKIILKPRSVKRHQ